MKRSNAGQKRTEAGVPLGEGMTPNNGIDRSAQELRSWVPVALRAPAPGHAERWASRATPGISTHRKHPGGRMKAVTYFVRVVAFLAVAAFSQVNALAQDKACLLDGNFKIGGQQVIISDCAENRTMPKEEFREVCAGMSEFTLAGETYRAKVTFLTSCPAVPQGTCEGMFGGAMNAYYYKRDAKTLADTRKACLAQQGRWK
jgi:hypothetical protein